MLSRQVIAYYGLIRASRHLPARLFASSGRPLPGSRGARGSPLYSAHLSRRAAFRTPADPTSGQLFSSTSALAFAFFAQARHPHPTAAGSPAGRVTRLQSSLYAAARWFACPTPARAFTFELSPHRSPWWGVEYNYTGIQSIPVAGLAPARYAALWAANEEHEGRIGRALFDILILPD